MKRTIAVYEERTIEGHNPLEIVTPPHSKTTILSATNIGPDVLFKYVTVWEEDDDELPRAPAHRADEGSRVS